MTNIRGHLKWIQWIWQNQWCINRGQSRDSLCCLRYAGWELRCSFVTWEVTRLNHFDCTAHFFVTGFSEQSENSIEKDKLHFSHLSISLEEQLIFQRRHISNTIVRSFQCTKSLWGVKMLCWFRKDNNTVEDETLKRKHWKMELIMFPKPSTDNTNSEQTSEDWSTVCSVLYVWVRCGGKRTSILSASWHFTESYIITL